MDTMLTAGPVDYRPVVIAEDMLGVAMYELVGFWLPSLFLLLRHAWE
jgi:hypothetical protein